jgi:hypothetical protein
VEDFLEKFIGDNSFSNNKADILIIDPPRA